MADIGRSGLFEGLKPEPVVDVAAAVGDNSTATRRDGPKRGRISRSGRSRNKRVQGSRAALSDMQWLELVACFGPLWELALQLESLIDASTAPRRAGRSRKYKVFDMLLFEVLTWTLRSYERVEQNLADPVVWNQMRSAVEVAWPDDPRRRLAADPPNRSQHYRFRKRWLSDYLLEVIHNRTDETAVEAALSMGMLTPGLGSLTDPDPASFVTGDGCWVPALTKLTRKDATDPRTGEIVGRYARDALSYHNRDDDVHAVRGSQGYLLTMVAARNPYRQERVVLTTRLKSNHNPDMNQNDATIAVDALLNLLERVPSLRPGLRGMVYDMALSVADFDRLLDAGLIPVSKVPLTTRGQVAADTLGAHTFKTASGTKVNHVVTAVNGTPCVTLTDGTGTAYYQPLKLRQVTTMKRKTRTQMATRWSIPDTPLVPPHLQGATTRIRHTRNIQERAENRSRSRALRIFPESDEHFDAIFGRREDSESTNADYKARLWNGRCRTLEHLSVEFNSLSYQVHTVITALVAHSKRTGADVSRWFGQYPLTGTRHLALAA